MGASAFIFFAKPRYLFQSIRFTMASLLYARFLRYASIPVSAAQRAALS
jgi:hypothetical protein